MRWPDRTLVRARGHVPDSDSTQPMWIEIRMRHRRRQRFPA